MQKKPWVSSKIILIMMVRNEMLQLGDVIDSNIIEIQILELFDAFLLAKKLRFSGVSDLLDMLKPRYKRCAGAAEMLDVARIWINYGPNDIGDKKDLMKCIK
jgi:hypothetical protein